MKLSVEKAIELLDECREITKDNNWIEHSICVGNTAGKIANALNMDEDYAKTLGYIHDIGKKFGWSKNDGVLPHAIKGYEYLKSIGCDEKLAGICIKHSFLNNDINCLANDRDYTDKINEKYYFVKDYISKEYSIYDKIINICDLMCTTKIQTVDKRIMDLLIRHGIYKHTHYHIIETYKLKDFFDNILGYNLYDLFPEIKENL